MPPNGENKEIKSYCSEQTMRHNCLFLKNNLGEKRMQIYLVSLLLYNIFIKPMHITKAQSSLHNKVTIDY